MNSYDNVLVDDGSGHAGGGWFSAEIDYGSGPSVYAGLSSFNGVLLPEAVIDGGRNSPEEPQPDVGPEAAKIAKDFNCGICLNSFTSSGNLKAHMRTHTGEKPYTCEQCESSFAQSSNLKSHMRVHSGERPYECEECGVRFARSSHLTNHRRLHTGEKPYMCGVCSNGFPTSTHLRNHMKKHKSADRQFACHLCPGKFYHSKSLEKHIKVHQGLRPFRCSKCEGTFKTKRDMISHSRLHARIKPFKCNVCSGNFKNKQYMMRHQSKCVKLIVDDPDDVYHAESAQAELREENAMIILSQNLVENYGDDLDSASFSDVQQHDGYSSQNKCSQCDETFWTKEDLISHVKLHTSRSKPFKCNVCYRNFKNNPNMLVHQIKCAKKVNHEMSEAERVVNGTYDEDTLEDDPYPEILEKTARLIQSLRNQDKFPQEDAELDDGSNFIFDDQFENFDYPEFHKKTALLIRSINLSSNINNNSNNESDLDPRPFECDQCGGTFRSREFLISHSKLHASLKAYKCKVCLRRFSSNERLLAHQSRCLKGGAQMNSSIGESDVDDSESYSGDDSNPEILDKKALILLRNRRINTDEDD